MTLNAKLLFYQNVFKVAESKGKDQVSLVWRELCKTDLFFLLRYACKSVGYLFIGTDKKVEWIYDRCNEVQKAPDGCIDLWFREAGKSSVITFGKTIQDILNDPEVTVGIFSHTRPIAKGFLRQIKRELEENEILKGLFPDVLYANPQKDSPKWSEDDGCIVRRKMNPNAATIEAWGLVDSQPISKHFKILVYDDVVTKDSVTSPEMIFKTTEAWELSLNLGMEGGKKRHVGTFYHYNDTYNTIIARKAAVPRIYPGTIDGTAEGEPTVWTPEYLAEKRTSMGPYTFATQILLNPKHDSIEGFDDNWLKFWPASQYKGLNFYIFCDPANEKSKKSDYTVFMLIGAGADKNYYIISMVRDRLNLIERANVLFQWHRDYRPKGVFYEKYGMQSDIQHYQSRMNDENYRFKIQEVGGPMPKPERIKKLIPLFEQGRIFLPETCIRTNYEKRQEDLVKIFVSDEYRAFPFCAHDDMLDCLARIKDEKVNLAFPDLPTGIAGATLDQLIKLGIMGKVNEYNPLEYEVSL